MRKMKVIGRKKEVAVAEWDDVKDIVKRIIKEERKYLAMMANL